MMVPVYKPPIFFKNGHIQSIYPNKFRKIEKIHYKRERINTFDGDFLDLDWSCKNSDKLVIVSHGLEGNTYRSYVKGMVKAMNKNGFDALAWNFRGCSGEMNKLPRLYHSGASEDLDAVIQHALKMNTYKEIYLTGFSMGGNVSLVYLGRMKDVVDERIKKCIVFSVPCDLRSSCEKMALRSNKIYMKRFLRMLHEKIKVKTQLYPELINDENYKEIKTFMEFDGRYTAPLHGFQSAYDYYEKCSSKRFIQDIRVKTVIVNAKDDPFLTKQCFPVNVCNESVFVELETVPHGGHVGFVLFNKDNIYWSEKRAVSFFKN